MKLNKEEVQELMEFLGVFKDVPDEFEIASFKKAFKEKFTVSGELEEEKGKLGKRMGAAETEIKRLMKDAGIEFDEGELKEKSIEDIVKIGLDKKKESIEAELKELKDAGAQTKDKRVEELEGKLTSMQTQWDQDKEALGKVKTQFEEAEKEGEEKYRGLHISQKVNDAKSKVSFIDELTDLHKTGFEATIKEAYNFDLDTDNKLIVTDKEGKRIEDPKKAGEYLGAEDVFKNLARENKILKQNGGGNVTTPKPGITPPVVADQKDLLQRTPHPNAVAAQ